MFASALYDVHPVMAETVNYIIQRADLYSTLGVIAGLVLYAARPDVLPARRACNERLLGCRTHCLPPARSPRGSGAGLCPGSRWMFVGNRAA
ncbi:MAG TPA: hypothetical protein VNH18_25640 [Bryobacteraceae bacterium]|nr:hypothetical protein [Bryobacteraceae bacterium]